MSKEKSLWPMLAGVSLLGIGLMLGAAYIISKYLVKGLSETASPMHRTERELSSIELGYRNYRGPMYPNAQRVEKSKETIAVDIPSNGSFEVLSAEYVTEDGLEQAIGYYRKYFGGRATERLEPGGARWVEKLDDGFGVVAVKETPQKLHVKLVRVIEESD